MIVTQRNLRYFSRNPALPVLRIGPAFLILMAMGAAPASLPAQEVDLSWGFRPGEIHRYRIGLESRSGTPIGDVVQIQVQLVPQEVLAVQDDGTARLALTFEHVLLVQDSPLGRQSFDSELGVDPGGPAVPGTTWEEISEVVLPIGLASSTRWFTYLGAIEAGKLSDEIEIDLDRGILLHSNVRTEMLVSALGQETRIVTVQTIELVDPWVSTW